MQTTIEINNEKYWSVIDVSKLVIAEITALEAELFQINLVFNYSGNDMTEMKIEMKFTAEEIKEIVESIKAIKNPRQELPPRGFLDWLFNA